MLKAVSVPTDVTLVCAAVCSVPVITPNITLEVVANAWLTPSNQANSLAAKVWVPMVSSLMVRVPAVKLPEASRVTMALIVLALVALVAELLTLPAVAMVASLVSSIAAEVCTSAFVNKEVESRPTVSV